MYRYKNDIMQITSNHEVNFKIFGSRQLPILIYRTLIEIISCVYHRLVLPTRPILCLQKLDL
jgi:hypothetical protein